MKRSTKSKLFRRMIWLLAIACLVIGYLLSFSAQDRYKRTAPPEVFTK